MSGKKDKPSLEDILKKQGFSHGVPSTMEVIKKIQHQQEALKKAEKEARRARTAIKKTKQPRNLRAMPASEKTAVKQIKVEAKHRRNSFEENVRGTRNALQDLHFILAKTKKESAEKNVKVSETSKRKGGHFKK